MAHQTLIVDKTKRDRYGGAGKVPLSGSYFADRRRTVSGAIGDFPHSSVQYRPPRDRADQSLSELERRLPASSSAIFTDKSIVVWPCEAPSRLLIAY